MRLTPTINSRYWLALVAASIFGTNTGDFVSDYLHIGHMSGLPYLAVLLVAILWLERFTAEWSIVLFWAAIITVRTAATNVGDAFHDFGISLYASVPIMLAVFGAAVFFQDRASRRLGNTIRVNNAYWACMVLAGVLGTVGGDFASFRLHLTTGGAAALFGVLVVASIFYFGRTDRLTRPVPYWTTVALIRTGGTAAGDGLAHVLGLPLSTCLTGLVFCALVAFHSTGAPRASSAKAVT